MYINDSSEKMKKEQVLQFSYDTSIISHTIYDENLLCEINSVFQDTDIYIRQKMLTLKRDKTEFVVLRTAGNNYSQKLFESLPDSKQQ